MWLWLGSWIRLLELSGAAVYGHPSIEPSTWAEPDLTQLMASGMGLEQDR